MLRICLLVSGGLGAIILEQIQQSPYQLAAVFTNLRSEEIIKHCKQHNIPVFIGNPRNGKASSFIENLACDIVLSVNYLFIIEKDIIKLPNKYAINIHGSLLPKYRGRTPHVWAIINGEKEAGISIHLINEEVDQGDLIQQLVIPIDKNDTGASVLQKYNKAYPFLVNQLLHNIEKDTLVFTKQEEKGSTYFGARTPADGQINWDWSKERIRNWIRAQAKPYPGAFSFYEEEKILIHKAEYSDVGFHYQQPNGTILVVKENTLVIKTPNGALELKEIETNSNIAFQAGKILK